MWLYMRYVTDIYSHIISIKYIYILTNISCPIKPYDNLIFTFLFLAVVTETSKHSDISCIQEIWSISSNANFIYYVKIPEFLYSSSKTFIFLFNLACFANSSTIDILDNSVSNRKISSLSFLFRSYESYILPVIYIKN